MRSVEGIRIFDVRDLSKKLEISEFTVRNYLRKGIIKGRKIGVRWWVTRDSLREYLNSNHFIQS